MTRGRPTTGKVREHRIPDELYEPLEDEARQEGVPTAEMLRRILAGRYEEEKASVRTAGKASREAAVPTPLTSPS